MSLITCPDCEKEISSNAPTCPGCGAPIAEKTTKAATTRGGGKFEAIGTLLILGGMIYGMSSPPDNHYGLTAALIGFVVFLIGRFN